MELTLLWAALTGVGLMWLATRLWPERLSEHDLDHLTVAAAIGLFTGRIAAMVGQGTSPLLHPADIIVVRGGVHTGAAAIGAIVALAWMTRRERGALDAVAPAALAGLAGWHLGCIWRGACLGSVSELPWAWAQPGSDITRHPVELYVFAGLLVAAWVVASLPATPYLRAGAALGVAGLALLATEPLRLSISGGPVGWYAAAAVAGCLVVAGAVRRRPKSLVPT